LSRVAIPYELKAFAALMAALAMALLLPVWFGAGSAGLLQALAVVVISLLSTLAGSLLASWNPWLKRQALTVPVIVVGGFVALSLLHLTATAALQLDARGALLVDGLVITGLAALTWYRQVKAGHVPDLHDVSEQRAAWRAHVVDIGMLLLISCIVTLWTREALRSVHEAQVTGILRVWNDFLLQASEIKYLENYPAFAGHSPYLADTAQPFYHRASYALSAVYSWISGDGPLETATYFWTPAGIILLGMGAYAFGIALAGRRGAALAVLALFLAPDASMYGLRNGYFAFHWLIQVAPGAGYAMAIALLALGIYVVAAQHARLGFVVAAAAFAGFSVFFRVHVAIPAVGMFAILVLVGWRPAKMWHWFAVALCGLAGAVGAVFASEHIALAPHLLTGQKDYLRYIEAVHAATPTAYERLYAAWTVGASEAYNVWLGYALMLMAELGALLPALILTTLLRVRAGVSSWRIDCIPYVLLCVHAGITFLLPTAANGDITEWSHRSFVLVYAVILVFEAAVLAGWWLNRKAAIAVRWPTRLAVPAALTIAGLMVPWFYGKNIQYGSLRDGPTACATPMSPDMFRTTQYLREHAQPADRMLASDTDPLAVAVALTGLQAYVSRVDLYAKLGGQLGAIAITRWKENAMLRNVRSFHELAAFGRYSGVRWYLLRQQDMPWWPQAVLDRAVYVSGGMRVFDLQAE
jgi:hypothetical protein